MSNSSKPGRPTVSLIVSTYNRPDALDLCLQSIERQSVLPDEVVVGDDGSRAETVDLVKAFQKRFPVPLVHVWQEDKGFRLAMSRNRSVAASRSEYIIEIDGDLILERHFVEDHLRFARKNHFLKGGRVNLTQSYTEELCAHRVLPRIHFFSRGVARRVNSLRNSMLSAYLAPRYKKGRVLALGCNMSFWKEDYIRINGYDEFFVGWGGEDYDFASRMQNSGVQRLHLKFAAVVYHLWHNDLYMQNKDGNFEYYNEKKDAGAIRCENGVDQYL